jgi:two-component system sensor histidine kinase PhoQ
MRSLHSRLLLAASLMLAGFLGATGLALDKAFRVSAEASMQDRLQSYIYALLAATDEDRRGRMIPPEDLPEPRFSKLDSGLYALVAGEDGTPIWHSASLTGRDLAIVDPQAPGARYFHRRRLAGMELYVINYGVAWVDHAGTEGWYTFVVAEDASAFEAEIEGFRTTLWGWLGAMAVALLLAQGLILRWGLRPLRTVAADLQRIEQGRVERLDGTYPKELAGLTSNINSLIEHRSAAQIRYRNSLDDLAHSLKTPLAILQSFFEEGADKCGQDRTTEREQVMRMDEIIRHQLQRAAVSGRAALAPPVPVAPVVERLVHSLDKVYRDKQVQVRLNLDPQGVFHGDEADLMEVLGNVLDNAYKYSDGRVRITARSDVNPEGRHALEISVEDDGRGIEAEKIDAVLQRGRRMDETVPGHGIGLSIANEIIKVYAGKLDIGSSDLGGAVVRIRFGG